MTNLSARVPRSVLLAFLPFGAAAQTGAIEPRATHINGLGAATDASDVALPGNQCDFVLFRDGVAVTEPCASVPASPQSRASAPRSKDFRVPFDEGLCSAYTVGHNGGWQRPMQLYLGEGSRWYLPIIKKSIQAWNDLFARDIIELQEDEVDYPYGRHPYDPNLDSTYYSDDTSVIYFHPREWGGASVAWAWQSWNASENRYEIDEADVFVSMGTDERLLLEVTIHELGHALGLDHITVSGNIMSYDYEEAIIHALDPLLASGFFPDYGTELGPWDWSYFFAGVEIHPLAKNLVRPQPQDQVMLGCVYDFSTWGQ